MDGLAKFTWIATENVCQLVGDSWLLILLLAGLNADHLVVRKPSNYLTANMQINTQIRSNDNMH